MKNLFRRRRIEVTELDLLQFRLQQLVGAIGFVLLLLVVMVWGATTTWRLLWIP